MLQRCLQFKKYHYVSKNTLILVSFALLFITISTNGQNSHLLPKKVEVTVKQDEKIPNKPNTLDIIKDWLIPVSTCITLLSISFGVYQSLKEYRLKLLAESRLADSTAVEMDIKLMQGFIQLLALAHARKGSYLSEKTVEKMFDNKLFY